MFARFLADQRGATAIEYGLIAAAMSLGILVSLKDIQTAFSDVVAQVKAN